MIDLSRDGDLFVLRMDHDENRFSPEMLDGLRRDIISVITRYMEIDSSRIEMDFDRADRSVAFVANIPVIRIKRGVAPLRDGEQL